MVREYAGVSPLQGFLVHVPVARFRRQSGEMPWQSFLLAVPLIPFLSASPSFKGIQV